MARNYANLRAWWRNASRKLAWVARTTPAPLRPACGIPKGPSDFQRPIMGNGNPLED